MATTREASNQPTIILKTGSEQPTALWNALTGLAISVTSRRPSLINGISAPQVILDQKDVEAIKFINENSTPNELVDLIFAKPPFIYASMQDNPENTLIMVKPPSTIAFTPAPEKDMRLADSVLTLPEGLNNLQIGGLRDRILLTCASFLKAGRITDGFTEKRINDRSLWAIGINETLEHVTKHETNAKNYDWSTSFNDRWNNDRYKNSKRTAVIMNLQMAKMLQLPADIQAQIDTAILKVEAGNRTFAAGEIDKGVDMIAEACADLVGYFKTSST